MIEYVFAHNPDDRVLKKACKLLSAGELVCIPSDTNWVILADPFSKTGVDSLYKIKDEHKSHHFSVLCSSISMASQIANITDRGHKLIRSHSPGHYTFIFEAKKKMIKALKSSKTDHQVGIRFVPSHLCQSLLETMQGPLLSTNITWQDQGEVYSYQLEDKLSPQVSMIIDPGEYEFAGASTIYSFLNDEVELVRQGVGKLF